ncbi:MAG: hemerythrin family protein [Desulfobacterales bacterium]|nr:hemerythrin family protein [Desulfobacterales bacterium]MCP4160545.1 hemerythrin family protein [Deltaproteobacteria bacterium]
MEQIVWSDNFSVGVKLFDDQHKRLIAMLNKMIKNPMATTKSETVSDVLSDMTNYAQQHFKSEEDLMIEHGYPHLEQQKKQHKEFREKVLKLCTATSYEVEAVPQVLLDYLKQWLTQHILHEDMEYKTFFEEKGVC